MKAFAVLVLLAACGGSSTSTPPVDRGRSAPPMVKPSATPERRCLPVVAKDCGCVYTCGGGERTGDHWIVRHSFWNDAPLNAVVEPWCVAGKCTDAFAAEIVCGVICAPKPADSTCHFDPSGACVGAPQTP